MFHISLECLRIEPSYHLLRMENSNFCPPTIGKSLPCLRIFYVLAFFSCFITRIMYDVVLF